MTTLNDSAVNVNASATIPSEVTIDGKSYESSLFIAVVRCDFHGKLYDSADTDEEIGLNTPEAFAETLAVYASEPNLFETARLTYKSLLAERAESATPANVNASTDTTPKLSAEETSAVYKDGVKRIAGLIVTKLMDDGERNFAIGKEAYEMATWQRSQFPNYTPGDFDNLMRDIRVDVRLAVSIKPESIRVDDWLRSHVLRTLIAESIGDEASRKLSNYEYKALCSRALTFDKKEVVGALVPAWVDFIKGIALDRTSGVRVSADDFQTRLDAHVAALAAAEQAKLDPATAEKLAAGKAAKEKQRAITSANEAITTAISDAFADSLIDGSGVASILEAVAKTHKVALPVTTAKPTLADIDVSSLTTKDVNAFAKRLFTSGNADVMRALHARLGQMVAAIDAAMAGIGAPEASATIATPVAADATPVANAA